MWAFDWTFAVLGSCGFGDSCWYSHTNPQMLLAAQGASKYHHNYFNY